MARTPAQVIHDSLQEWNVEEFVEMDWNTKAAERVLKELNEAGYIITHTSIMKTDYAPSDCQ